MGKVDLDDVFAYQTERVVVIRDRRLGFLYYGATLGIFIYIVVVNIVLKQGYKIQGAIVGTTRLQLQHPPPQPLSALEYCGNGTYSYKGTSLSQYDCRYLDEFDAVYPSLETASISMTTRIVETPQYLPKGCTDILNPGCKYVNESSYEFFVADAEMFTLLIDHTMNVPTLGISQTALEMQGNIVDQEGNAIDPCHAYTLRNLPCPSYINVDNSDQYDILPLATLLEAAGIESLDAPAEIAVDQGESWRESGMVLLLQIFYNNYVSYHESKIVYTYSVSAVANTEFKMFQVLPGRGADESTRTILNRHGIRVAVVQTGTVGVFDFSTLLIQLVSSMGLLAVAKVIVDFMLQYVMPLKHIYRQYKNVTSVDFSDLNQQDIELFKHHDLVNPRPRIPHHLRDSEGGERSSSAYKALNED